MKKYLILFLVVTSSNLFAQEITQKFNFSDQLSENSGLIYFDGKIITHNDSGGKPVLYELDALTGEVLRIITLTNTLNIDWEDITQDANYIYISDSGNNMGNRTNLKIYKVSKKDYLSSSNITAQIINYSYSDQKDFRYSSKNNFDAEALVSYYDHLLIFSKNRGNQKTKIYKIPKKVGTHTAEKINTININGQVTGATYNHKANSIILCGYSSSLSPFLIFLDNFDIKSKSFVKVDVSDYVGAMSQIEGISYSINDEILISRERFRKKIGGFSIDIPSTVFVFNKEELTFSQRIINKSIKDFSNNTSFNPDFQILKVTDELGKRIFKKIDTITPKSILNLPSGNYYIKVKTGFFIANQKYTKQ